MRRGWTLHEMLLSMTVIGVILTVAVQVSVSQQRLFRGASDVASVHSQAGGAAAIAASLLRNVAPQAGDIVVAVDSAIEIQAPIGTAVVCGSAPGSITIPSSAPASGNALGSFIEPPEADDRVLAYWEDSLPGAWRDFTATEPALAGDVCSLSLPASSTWRIALREAAAPPVGSAVRMTRGLRLSLYRASDGFSYLGARDWNGDSQRFNTIQPVAGPLDPYSADKTRTGLLFSFRDRAGVELPMPVEVGRIASVRIVARGLSRRPVRVAGIRTGEGDVLRESVTLSVAPRNVR